MRRKRGSSPVNAHNLRIFGLAMIFSFIRFFVEPRVEVFSAADAVFQVAKTVRGLHYDSIEFVPFSSTRWTYLCLIAQYDVSWSNVAGTLARFSCILCTSTQISLPSPSPPSSPNDNRPKPVSGTLPMLGLSAIG